MPRSRPVKSPWWALSGKKAPWIPVVTSSRGKNSLGGRFPLDFFPWWSVLVKSHEFPWWSVPVQSREFPWWLVSAGRVTVVAGSRTKIPWIPVVANSRRKNFVQDQKSFPTTALDISAVKWYSKVLQLWCDMTAILCTAMAWSNGKILWKFCMTRSFCGYGPSCSAMIW